MPSSFQYAIFDFDGVVVDSEPVRLKTYADLICEAFGVKVELDVDSMVGRPESFNLAGVLQTAGIEVDVETISQLRLKRSQMLIDRAREGFPKVESVSCVIEQLKALGVPMAIVTNSSASYLEAAFKSIQMDLDEFYIVTADDVGASKPDPAGYVMATRELGNVHANGLAFEDSVTGIMAARGAKLGTVGVLSTHGEQSLDSDFYLNPHNDPEAVSEILRLFGK